MHNPNGPQSKMSTVEVMQHVEVPPRSRLPVMDKMLPMKSSGVCPISETKSGSVSGRLSLTRNRL